MHPKDSLVLPCRHAREHEILRALLRQRERLLARVRAMHHVEVELTRALIAVVRAEQALLRHGDAGGEQGGEKRGICE